MLDTAREQHAAIKALDPLVVRHSRSVRLTSLILGIASLGASALLLVLGLRFWLVVLLFSGSQFAMAAFFTPRAVARRRLEAQTDLTRFATERDEPRR